MPDDGPRSGIRRSRQRRRRFAAAVLCLGTLGAAVTGSFFASGAANRAGAPDRLSGTVRVPVIAAVPSQAAADLLDPLRRETQSPVQGPVSSGTARPGVAKQDSQSPSPSAGPERSSGGVTPTPPSALDSPASTMAVSDPLTGTAFSGLPQVGAIFGYSNGSTTSHFCSGSVVDSTAGDLIVTAAHCVYDAGSGTYINDIAFVPGYHDGQQPYGVWTPSKIVVAQQWMDDADPDYDVAFVVVHQPGSDQRIQDAVGADELATNPTGTALTQVVGYPSTTEQPVTCTNTTKQFSSTQLEFDCANFPGGTSGGPFLTALNPVTGLGIVSGVIGGYEEGGDTPDVSYSTYFGSAVAALYAQAEAAG